MNIIVLDTETCGGMGKPLVYDLGYTIYQNDKVVANRSYVIDEIFNNHELFETAYYKEKRPLYEDSLENEEMKLIKFKYALIQLIKDIKKYQVENLYAYNSPFDVRSIKSTIEKLNLKSNPAEKIVDIMKIAESITKTDDYKKFCEDNGYMTKHKKPQPRRNAETLGRYLKGNKNFTEDHIALSDSLLELEILLKALGGINP